MPFARFDVEIIRRRFAAIPEKQRPAAIALYQQLVLTSAQLLLDGELALAVVTAGAQEIGISRGRYGRSEVQKIVHSIAATALVEERSDGSIYLCEWREHHSSRTDVEELRKRDAERKRERRGQLTLPDVRTNVQPGHAPDVQPGHAEDSRARARGRSESEKELGPKADVYVDAANGLPFEKELQITKLLAAIGNHADPGTAHVLRSYAGHLPEAALAKVLESLRTGHPRNRAKFVVAALRNEIGHHDPEPRL